MRPLFVHSRRKWNTIALLACFFASACPPQKMTHLAVVVAVWLSVAVGVRLTEEV